MCSVAELLLLLQLYPHRIGFPLAHYLEVTNKHLVQLAQYHLLLLLRGILLAAGNVILSVFVTQNKYPQGLHVTPHTVGAAAGDFDRPPDLGIELDRPRPHGRACPAGIHESGLPGS